MKKLVLATNNQGKVNELAELLKDLNVMILSLKDFPDIPEVIEDGETFAENALIKASAVCRATGILTLADDSGLEVDALNGAPGVYSARFAGPQKNDADNNQKLLSLLVEIPEEKRTARFRCSIALMTPEGMEKVFEGTCEGYIGQELRGKQGFGYDPLFYLPEFGKTFAELDLNIKNNISHRGKAFSKAVEYLQNQLRG